MKKNIFIFMLIIMLLCSACTDSRNKETDTRIQEENETRTSIQEEAGETFDDYQILNGNLLGKEFLNWPGEKLIQKGAWAYAEEIREGFVPVFNESIRFPEELVVVLEEILYDSGHIDVWTDENFFYTPMEKWKDNVDTLDAKDYADCYPDLYKAFRFLTDGKKEYYVFENSDGGTNGASHVCVVEYRENEFIEINEFAVESCWASDVICYEGEFYYVFIQNNYNLKIWDGIRIYKLLGTQYDNLEIRYLPEQFIWKRLYYNGSKGDEVNSEIEAHLDILKEEIMPGGYIDNGTFWGMEVYYGDEEIVPDLKIDSSNSVQRPYEPIYKIDLANCSLPVYLWKTEYTPSNARTSEYLKIKFFYYDEKEQAYVELENLCKEEGLSGHINLVQMWFREIGGEIYTFRMYHAGDYNYMLNIVLLEGDNVTQIRSDIVIPQRHFVLTEGEVCNPDS